MRVVDNDQKSLGNNEVKNWWQLKFAAGEERLGGSEFREKQHERAQRSPTPAPAAFSATPPCAHRQARLNQKARLDLSRTSTT